MKRYFVDYVLGGEIYGIANKHPKTEKPFTGSSAHAYAKRMNAMKENEYGNKQRWPGYFKVRSAQ